MNTMNLAQQIKQWFIEKRSYFEGVTLYSKMGGNTKYFESYFTANYVPENIANRLSQYLENYLKDHQTDLAIPIEKTPSPSTPIPILAIPKNSKVSEPPTIQDLRKKAKPLHKRFDFLKAELRHQKQESKRYDIALEIMTEVIPALDKIYTDIKHFEATGALPIEEKHNTEFQKGVAAMLRKGTLSPRISKIKRMLRTKLDPVRQQELEKELLDKELELKQINELIAK